MKLSIWQQFSSNHSAHFTIVGIFRSSDDAQTSAQKLRDVLEDIETWHTEHPEESEEMRQDGEEGVITPPERKISEQYRMDWQYPVLWTDNYSLEIFGQFVFLANNWGADSGAEPIDMLMRRLGADEAFVSGSMIWDADDRMLSVTVLGFAPDEDIAAALMEDIKEAVPGQDKRFIRVNIDHDDFAISKGRRFLDVLTQLQATGCKPITVNFEELRGFSISL